MSTGVEETLTCPECGYSKVERRLETSNADGRAFLLMLMLGMAIGSVLHLILAFVGSWF